MRGPRGINVPRIECFRDPDLSRFKVKMFNVDTQYQYFPKNIYNSKRHIPISIAPVMLYMLFTEQQATRESEREGPLTYLLELEITCLCSLLASSFIQQRVETFPSSCKLRAQRIIWNITACAAHSSCIFVVLLCKRVGIRNQDPIIPQL